MTSVLGADMTTQIVQPWKYLTNTAPKLYLDRMRYYVRLPGPFGVGFQAPTQADLDLRRDAKIAEYYHQYVAYYREYLTAHEAGETRKANRLYRKCRKYAKKVGPYLPRDNPRWTFE